MTTLDQQTFRDAMACVGAAVNIITTDGPAGMAGFTASAVCSVTDTPPTLLVCLNRGASVWPIFSENRTLCVNTLSAGQEPLSNLFGGKTPTEDRFAAARWQTGRRAARVWRRPPPHSTAASAVVSVGTHDILFCDIVSIVRHPAPQGLVWFDRGYHALMRPAC